MRAVTTLLTKCKVKIFPVMYFVKIRLALEFSHKLSAAISFSKNIAVLDCSNFYLIC